ncbi:unnamed protein product [Closterium sp. NIES-65]|nr:unnamed protein product [Closterium sp. NIES-65]
MPGRKGVTSWHIHFPGGGWCATKSRCARRAGQLLGGTTSWPPTNNASWVQCRFEGILSSNEGANPFFAGWHLAMAVYCDGGRYAGAAGRVVVGKRRYVHMDGSRIASAILHDLLENRALSRATTVLVSGTSAGGLAVMRLCDSLAALLPRATVKCLLDGSFFPVNPRFPSFSLIRPSPPPPRRTGPHGANALPAPDRTGQMHFQYLAQQVSALHQFSPQSCCDQVTPTSERWQCFFPRYALPLASSPYFIVFLRAAPVLQSASPSFLFPLPRASSCPPRICPSPLGYYAGGTLEGCHTPWVSLPISPIPLPPSPSLLDPPVPLSQPAGVLPAGGTLEGRHTPWASLLFHFPLLRFTPPSTASIPARRGITCGRHLGRAPHPVGVSPIPLPPSPLHPPLPRIYPSPPGYYLREAPWKGASTWHIHFPGGGWCGNKRQCRIRAGMQLGSTSMWPETNNGQFLGILSSSAALNPFFAGWHLAMAVYCDGGGYAGAAGRVAVGEGRYVHMDGSRIASAIMDDLLANRAIARATTVLVSGTSAGGLAVVRLCDSLAALLPRATVKCLLDGSFFPGTFSFSFLLVQCPRPHGENALSEPSPADLSAAPVLAAVPLRSRPPQKSPSSLPTSCLPERLTDDDELVVRRPTTPFHPSLCLFLVPACSDPCV